MRLMEASGGTAKQYGQRHANKVGQAKKRN